MKHKFKLTRLLVASLLLLFGFSPQAWAATRTYNGSEKLFIKNIKPNGWGDPWSVGGDYCLYVYMYGGTAGEKWMTPTLVEGTKNTEGCIYSVTPPSGSYTNIILTRGSCASWNCKKDQTGDISLDATKNYISGGYSNNSSTNATWSTYSTCTTPTISWSTAPADGVKGGSMTASVTKNQSSATVSWQSSNTSVATVTSAGVISYVGAGKTTISAQYTGSGDYCAQEAKVTKDITVLDLDPILNGTKIMAYVGLYSSYKYNDGIYLYTATNDGEGPHSANHGWSYKYKLSYSLSKTLDSKTFYLTPATIDAGRYYFGEVDWSPRSANMEAGGTYLLYNNTISATGFTQACQYDYSGTRTFSYKATNATTTATTTIDATVTQGGQLSVSTSSSVGKSSIGNTNSFQYYLYNGSNWSKITLSNGKADVSGLAVGTGYKIATVLYDGYIYVKADEDNFTVTPSCTTPTIAWNVQPVDGEAGGSCTASVTTNQSNPTIIWHSSDESVATVTNGFVNFIAAGTAKIKAYYTGSDDYCEETVSTSEVKITVTPATTYKLTVVGDAHVTGVSGSTDPITLGSSYPIAATSFAAGYEFDHWSQTGGAGTAVFDNENAASTTVTVKNGSVTVTANAKEHPYTITVVNGTSFSTTACIATTGSATARAEGENKKFTNWTFDGTKITLVGCQATDETITFNASADATVTANFVPFDLNLVASDNITETKEATITPTLTAPAGKYTICYSCNDISKFNVDNDGVATFTAPAAGTHTITVTVHQGADACEETAILTKAIDITVNPNLESGWHLLGQGGTNVFPGGWIKDDDNMMIKKSASESKAYLTIHVTDINTSDDTKYQFKLQKDDGTWYGYSHDGDGGTWLVLSATKKSGTLYTGDKNGRNVKFVPNIAGDYEFEVDYSNSNEPKVTITYPEAYKLTVAAGTGIASVTGGLDLAEPNKEYTITATTSAGYSFHDWSFSGIGASVKEYSTTDNVTTATVIMGTSDATFTANAQALSYQLTMPQSGTGYTVEYTGGTSIPCGQTVDFTVTPATGYDVTVKMNGATLTGTNNAYSFTMPAANATVTVVASLHNYEITMAVSPANSGTTDPTGNFTKHYNEVFDISAEANPGYRFVNWTSTSNINLGVGNPSGAYAPARKLANDVSLQMSKSQPNTQAQLVGVDGEKTITANFEEITYTVTVDGVNKQVGAITPVQINAAAAAADHQFKRWEFTGDVIIADVNQANTTIRATGTGTVTATYEVIPMYYTHGKSSTFAPTDSELMSYDEDKKAYYIDVITDNAEYYYRFKDSSDKLWGGAWTEYPKVVEVLLNGAKVDAKNITEYENKSSFMVQINAGSSIRVWFNTQTNPKQTWITGKDYITLTYDKVGDFAAGATLTFIADNDPTPDGDNTYPKGTTFTFTATPKSGDVVEGWFWNTDCPEDKRYTGGDLGVTKYTISKAQQDVYMYARFDHLNTVNIQVADGQEDMGTVKPTHTIPDVGAYAIGIAEAISKDPTLYSFDYWTLPTDVTLHDPCTINDAEIRINATTNDALLIANFKEREVVTVYFVNSNTWDDVHVHLWGGTADGTTWPGIYPKKENIQVNGHDVYSYTFDKGAYLNAQWNCGKQSCQTTNITIDENKPVYNLRDGKLYPSLDLVIPDPVENTQWRVMFGNEAKLLNYDGGHLWYAELENVPVYKDQGNNWIKFQEYIYSQSQQQWVWDWRGIAKVNGVDLQDDDKKITDYANTVLTVSHENGKQVDLAGHSQVANLTVTFDQTAMTATISYTQPVILIIEDNKDNFDVQKDEPIVLKAYPKGVNAQTFQFYYKKKGDANWTSLGAATDNNILSVPGNSLTGEGVYDFKVEMTYEGGAAPATATVTDIVGYTTYWVAFKETHDGDAWAQNVYIWNKTSGKNEQAFPGKSVKTYQEGDWYFFEFRNPLYDYYKVNNGIGESDATGDITFEKNTCYKIDGSTWEDGKWLWHWTKANDCPKRIYLDFPANEYWISQDGTLTLTPTIRYYGSDELTYSWTIESGSDKVVLSSTNTPQTIVNPIKTGTTKVKFTVSDGNEDHVYDITIHIIDGITIRVYNPYPGDWTPVIHTWGTGEGSGDFDMTNEGNGWYSHTTSLNPVNFMIKKNKTTGYNYEMTADVSNVTASGCWIVSTAQWDDSKKHKIDKTEDCALYYRVHETLADGKTTYHSNKVKKRGDDLSFFAAKDGTLTLQHYDESAGKFVDMKTLANPTASNVQVATFTGTDVEDMEQYEGNFYIRTGDGDWSQYVDNNHVMTQFTRNANFPNEMYSYYWVQNVAKSTDGGKTYVGAAVANAINDDLAGIIPSDAFTIQGGIDDNKINNSTNGTNIRFGYEPTTNYFKRAMINGSSDDHFLDVYGDNSTYFNGGKANSTLYKTEALADADIIYRDDVKSENYSLKFTDMSDWVYQAQVFARVDNTRSNDTKAIIASLYNGKWNYLLGYDEVNQCPTQAWTVLGNTSSKNITYDITLIYNFKTNRLMSAWTPTNMTVEESMEVDADVMFLRHENGDVAQIGIANETATVDNLNGVVFVLEVESEGDANTEKHYWVSTPFDVKVSDIFGLERFYDGVTGDAWGIQRYRGDLRAKTGWWAEGPDTWWEWMTKDDTIKAGEGYLISIDKSLFSWPSIEVDGEFKAIKRLYFPSVTSHLQMSRTKGESITQTYENQPCPFTRDRRDLKDGNWKIIGANSYNNAIATGGEAQGNYNEDAKTPAEGTKLPNFRYVHHDAPTVAGQSYTAELGYGPDVVYRAFYSYPVQYAGTITWQPFTTDDQKVQGIAPRRYAMENEVTNVILRLELQQNGKMMDQTFVQFNDAATTSYDLNLDLGKMGCGSKISEISTLDDNGVVYAGNSMPSGEYVIPVGANIKVAGTYTFAMPAGTENMTVYLLDYETGDKIDLGLGNYTVTFSKKANLKDRFALQIDNRKLPTDTKVMDANGNELIKFIRNEQMYILRNGHLYNANGAELSK